jgi:hypothetical protein
VNGAAPLENLAATPAPAQRPYVRLATGCLLLLAIPFLLSGICLTAVTVVQWNEFQQLRQSGVTTKATVVSRYAENDTYHINYRFTVNEEVFNDSDTVDRAVYDATEQGAQITIRYAQSDPTISRIGARESNDTAIGLTVCSACWDGFVLLWIGLALRTLLKARSSS